MLELHQVTKKYSVFPAVNRVSFSVQPGEIVGYLGPNGAGKSTTLKMLAGLLDPARQQDFARALFDGLKAFFDTFTGGVQ